MADLPLPQIREKKFRQQEIDLDQFTDEELFSKNRFGRESIQYLVEILKNAGPREKDEEKTQAVAKVVTTSCNKFGHYQTWTVDCGLNIRTMLSKLGQLFLGK